MNSFFTQKKQNHKRSLQLESLESRELLAASIMSAPIAAYAQTDNPAEIRIDLSASNKTATQLEFVVKQGNGSTLDPSKITILDGSDKAVTLSNIVDSKTSSSAKASLKTGVYTVLVYADNGKGNLTLDILQDLNSTNAKSGLETLVAAAITQQGSPSNWAGRAAYYNSLLAGTDYAGAASALPIYKSYPEVDVNGDGKVNAADLTLAKQQTTKPVKATVKSFQVIKQDLTAPALNIALQAGTSTENPVIAGSVTDASGIKSATYQRDGGTWTALTLDGKGNFTIENKNLAFGKHTLTIKMTDTKGNSVTSEPFTFTVTEKDTPSVLTAKQTTFDNIVSNDLRNEKKLIDPGFSVTDSDAKDKTGFVYSFSHVKDGSAAGADGLITGFNSDNGTFSIDTSKLSNRNAASTVTLTVSVTSVSGGVVSKTITVKLAPVAAPDAPLLSLNTTESEGITGNVQPAVAGKSFSVGNLTLIEGTLPEGVTAGDIVTLNEQGKFVFTAKEYFAGLSKGDVLKLKFRYTITDTEYALTGSGLIELTVNGKNNAPVVQLGNFVWNIPEDSEYEILNLAPYITDADANAEFSVTKINGKKIAANESVTLLSGATFIYLGALKFRYQTNGQFNNLSEGSTVEDKITLSISDGLAESLAALKTTITGKHSSMQLLSPPEVTLPPINAEELENGLIDDQIRLSKDSDDTVKYTVSCVDSQNKTYPDLFYIQDGDLYLDVAKYESLNLNETYIVTINIENTNTAYGDEPLSVVYTLNFVKRSAPIAIGNMLTVTEDAESGSVDLAAADSVAGQPLSELSGYDYSVVLRNNSTDIPLREGVDYLIENGVFTFKPNGKFNVLSASEKAVLTFRYKITDTEQGNGTYNAEGTITVTVNGTNDAPVLTASRDTYHTTNSNAAANASISAGVSFAASDPDDNDQAVLSVGTVSGTKNGLTLQKIPEFTLDASGNLWFANNNLPELLPGESATFTVEIIAVDKSGATDSKTVTIIVHAKQQPIVSVTESDRQIIESNAAVSQQMDISVSDPAETFLNQRTDNSWYAAPKLSIRVPDAYQSLFPDLPQLFTVKGNTTDGYSVAFDAPAGYFNALREGETFDVTISMTVTDTEFNVTTTESFTVTVIGKGTQHSVETAVPSFDYWVNKRTQDAVSFNPQYTIRDADRNENHSFSLQTVIVTQVPNGMTGDKLAALLTLNADGTLTLNESGLAGITENFSYQITVRVTGASDGLTYDVPLTLSIKFAQKPIIADVEVSSSEDESANRNLSVTVPDDGAVRSTDWYTVDAPSYAGFYGSVPNGFDIAAVARSIASVSGSTFTFEPEGHFDFLPEGTVLKIFYSYTVRDKVFATESTKTITVTITGVDDDPVFPPEQNFTVNTDGKRDAESVSIGTIAFNDADTSADQYTFRIVGDSTGEFYTSRTDSRSLFLIYYQDLFTPGQSYTFDVIASLKSNPEVSYRTTVTVKIGGASQSVSSASSVSSNLMSVFTTSLLAPQLADRI